MRRILMTFCLLFSCVIFAQQNAIIGKITDVAFNNEPLAFANVYIKGTSKGVTSDIDGIYALENIKPGTYTLIYSFVGYETVRSEEHTSELQSRPHLVCRLLL